MAIIGMIQMNLCQIFDPFSWILKTLTCNFNTFLWIMTALAAVVFVALYFTEAGYGIFISSKWGPAISNKVAWILMESPVFFTMLLFWLLSERVTETVPLVFLLLFEIHYFRRSFIFPLKIRGKSKMPIGIILMGICFNLLNACMQGGWIFYVSPSDMYTNGWMAKPCFWIGILLFLGGMFINISSDQIIRNLRKDGDSQHYLPKGGLFNQVTSAHYFGEIVEWIGFAVLTWSWAGFVFVLWTAANLVPRANAIYHRYQEWFPNEMDNRHLKRIFPYIY